MSGSSLHDIVKHEDEDEKGYDLDPLGVGAVFRFRNIAAHPALANDIQNYEDCTDGQSNESGWNIIR